MSDEGGGDTESKFRPTVLPRGKPGAEKAQRHPHHPSVVGPNEEKKVDVPNNVLQHPRRFSGGSNQPPPGKGA